MTPPTDSKSVLQRYVVALESGDDQTIRDLFADDATWSLSAGHLPISGTWRGRDTILNEFLATALSYYEPGSVSLDITSMLAEGDQVVLQCDPEPRRSPCRAGVGRGQSQVALARGTCRVASSGPGAARAPSATNRPPACLDRRRTLRGCIGPRAARERSGDTAGAALARPGDDTVDAGTAFSAGDDDPRRARTIHSAKGESHNAVLLLAQRPAGGRDFPREWVTHLLCGSRTEETRVAYVAMTRARRYVAVALPGATPSEVVDAYTGTGMVLVDRA